MKLPSFGVKVLLSTSLHHGFTASSPIAEVALGPSHGHNQKGGIASESKECSAIGRDLLAKGGNAVDALVGTTFCVGVIGMYHSGIGGGGFMMVRDADGGYEAIDFRESAPAAAFQDMYQGNVQGSIFGGLAAGVPGEVKGLEYAHSKYGALPWKTVMRGAIHIARTGFQVSEDLVKAAVSANNRTNFLLNDPNWAQEFAPNGTLIKVGDMMKRERLAKTLEKIAKEGSSAFYTGEIAESMIKTIQKTNGTMTLEDLKNYEIISRPVLKLRYRGLDLYGLGAPAGGAIALNILNIIEQYSPADWYNDRGLTTHRFDEAMRFAYSARVNIGDPNFVEGIDEFQSKLLSDDYAKAIKKRILDNQTMPVDAYITNSTYASESHGTSHVVAADASGMAASLTTTVNLLFGAQLMDPLSGVILNNEMNDFSIPGVRNEFGYEPSKANFIRPHKRPLSSITPIIASRPATRTCPETLVVAVGAAGGSRIVSSTAQVLWHALEHSKSLKESLAEPRLHDQLMPNRTMIEKTFNETIMADLVKRGHELDVLPSGFPSSVQGIWRYKDGQFEAAAEPRQKNSAGYTL